MGGQILTEEYIEKNLQKSSYQNKSANKAVHIIKYSVYLCLSISRSSWVGWRHNAGEGLSFYMGILVEVETCLEKLLFK